MHALYVFYSSWPFLRVLLPSSLSVRLSSRFFAIGYCRTRSAPCSFYLQFVRLTFSAKWKHRGKKKKIGVKEGQNKILLMLGFFCCCCYVPDHSVKIFLPLLLLLLVSS
jgi:hypothetical protein